MKKVQIFYWNDPSLDKLMGWKHQQEFERYDLNVMIHLVFSKGLNVFLSNDDKEVLMFYIAKGNFTENKNEQKQEYCTE